MKRALLAAALGAGISIAVHRRALTNWVLALRFRWTLRRSSVGCPERHDWGVDRKGARDMEAFEETRWAWGRTEDGEEVRLSFEGAPEGFGFRPGDYSIGHVPVGRGKSRSMEWLIAHWNALHPEQPVRIFDLSEGPEMVAWKNLEHKVIFGEVDPDSIFDDDDPD